MKFLLVVPCLFALTYAISEEYQNNAMVSIVQTVDKCVQDTKANDDDIAELMEKKPPSRREGKCLVHCCYNDMGVMKDGKISKEGTMAMLGPLKEDDSVAYGKAVQVMNKVFEYMADINEKDECEYAMLVSDSTTKAAKELNISLEDFMV